MWPVARLCLYNAAAMALPCEPVSVTCAFSPNTLAAQMALERSGVGLAITHAPGFMFVTDVRDEDLQGLAVTPGCAS